MSDNTEPTVEAEKTVKEELAEKPPVVKKTAAAEKTATPEKSTTAEKTATTEKPATPDKPVATEKASTAAKAPAAKAAAPAAKAAAKAATTGVESKTTKDPFVSRRRIIWASIVGFMSAISLMFVRFFLPRTLFEPSPIFRIGYPGDFSIGVDTKFQNQFRIWVVRNAERLFVIYARCTHLGCTPDWKQGENKFKCPCHGSGYDSEGINFEGPAPRPLDRANVKVDAEGQIVVDTSKLYSWPKGSKSDFDEPGAFVKV